MNVRLKSIGQSILSFLVAYGLYVLTVIFPYLVLLALATILGTNIDFLVNSTQQPTINFDEIYPNYSWFIYNFLFLNKWSSVLVFICFFAFLLFNYKHIKKFESKTLIFKIVIIYFFFLLFQVGVSLTDFFEKPFNGRSLDSSVKQCQQTFSDENGINRFLPNYDCLPNHYKINEQGFRSFYDFSPESIAEYKKENKIAMFIGDSYTEGCCATPITKSFVDLVDIEPGLIALNFGVGGTDPLQYKLVAEHYIHSVKPDFVVVPLCLGNDFMVFDRKPTPNMPMYFQTNYNWMDTYYPGKHQLGNQFGSWDEAKRFYLSYYTPAGYNPSALCKIFIEKVYLNTLLATIYKKIRLFFYYTSFNSLAYSITEEQGDSVTLSYLKSVQQISNENGAEFIMVGIPRMKDAGQSSELEMKSKFEDKLRPLGLRYPIGFERDDYISEENEHFNNIGHQKFADFLIQQIKQSSKYDSLQFVE